MSLHVSICLVKTVYKPFTTIPIYFFIYIVKIIITKINFGDFQLLCKKGANFNRYLKIALVCIRPVLL